MFTYLADDLSVIIFGDVDKRFSVPNTHFKTITPSEEIIPKTPNTVPRIKVKTIIIIITIQQK